MLPEGVDANRQAIPETIAFQSRNTRLHFHPSSRRIVADGSVCWTSARRDTKEQATAMAWTASTRDGLLRPLASGSYGGWMAWRQAAVRVRVRVAVHRALVLVPGRSPTRFAEGLGLLKIQPGRNRSHSPVQGKSR